MQLSTRLGAMAAVCADGRVTFRELMPGMTPRDQAVMTMFLSLCFLHPIPMLGTSMVLGSVILLAGARMAFGLGPWIPQSWVDRPLPARALAKVFGFFSRLFARFETLIKPRGPRFAQGRLARRMHGVMIAMCGLLIIIPLPPPTNFPPALALLLLSVGLLEDDAVVLLLGYLMFALNLLLFSAIFVYGLDGLRAVLS